MAGLSTNSIRAFQNKVHSASVGGQKNVQLSIVEAKNLSNELAQLTALLLEIKQEQSSQEVQVQVFSNRF